MSVTEQARIALICASNQNRSMETHDLLVKKGFRRVQSFGTNSQVKLPGTAADKPNAYTFATTYKEIYEDLKKKDEDFYTQKGLLNMVLRNSRIKDRPQRFQDNKDEFDIIITFEDRVFDIVCEELRNRGTNSGRPLHVINFSVKDTPEEAVIGAIHVHSFLKMLEEFDDSWEDQIDDVIDEFQNSSGRPLLHSVVFQ
eukprot:TRINITY_DN2360_c1_g1_i1.p1 TRINITY_DN2360_c1_g1~~TRINITY_DN2360_c1_g1_i1.p1  ORF type:complete len:198 (+),score=51.97 TRINITY_DN2360_c1_g1_i1:38-631(+)